MLNRAVRLGNFYYDFAIITETEIAVKEKIEIIGCENDFRSLTDGKEKGKIEKNREKEK